MNINDENNDLKIQSTVVEQTSNSSDNFISLTSLTNRSNTLPIELTFIHNENSYAILKKINITENIKPIPFIKLTSTGLIKQILLTDFPIGQYTLSLNGCNCATAKHNKFDFSGKKSDILIELISVTQPKYDYLLDFDRFDDKRIIISKNTKLNSKHLIQINERVINNDEIIDSIKNITVYPYNTYQLMVIKYPTESIEIRADNNDGTIIIKFDDIEFANFKSSENLIRINFCNPDKLYMGTMNSYLNEEINTNTINMGRVSNVTMIVLGCKIIEMYQICYKIYSYPNRTEIFR